MDDNALILPQILASLSAKPNNCETLSNLYNELEDYVCAKCPNTKAADARKRIKQILDVGQALGVLSIGSDKVKMTFKMTDYEKQPTPVQSDDDVTPNESQEDGADCDVDDPPLKSSRRLKESTTAVLRIKLSAGSIPLTDDDLDFIFNDSPRFSASSQSKRRASATSRGIRSSRSRKRQN